MIAGKGGMFVFGLRVDLLYILFVDFDVVGVDFDVDIEFSHILRCLFYNSYFTILNGSLL